ncbi:CpaF/VirB11 family protein [Peribacillus asahii]|uniref:CpaF/VirB11 family protein n=1 Tax=Peribacillus asahii TaxID=228899 RepID=UPI00207B033B|nr:CpaF/VirB11 family protein [Peribacillus asahii]USK68585.1 CpaF/VirB11 family protein [Peribacillus asahii]
MGRYSASKVRGVGRESWSIVFRHPVRKDQYGKAGLRIRRGLGTTDEDKAEMLVLQMNEILSNPTLWDLSSREQAKLRYDKRIVAAFYDALEPQKVNYIKLRDAQIPLPSSNQGYANVLLVGTTGAGKTTLLRQLIGTDPKKERFPSTSPNKTTVSDTEVICADGPYEAVVTFFDYREIRFHLEDCVIAAVLAMLRGEGNWTVAQRLLEHSEQRFRFFYVLGEYELDMDEDDFAEGDISSADEEVTTIEERKAFSQVISGYIHQIEKLAALSRNVMEQLGNELDYQELSPSDRNAFEELLEGELRQSKEFHLLVEDILEEMSLRFENLKLGEIFQRNGDWPIVWKFTSSNRELFIKTIRKFSSNYAPQFGKLLTPLVQGIRVKGPFKPAWCERVPKLILTDGQGLGHTASTSSSIPSQTLRKFESSDAVLLVDSAKHPMQAASLAVLRSLASSGHIAKLRICFTHMDELTGDSLRNRKSRIRHVNASLNQAANYIRERLGPEVALNMDVSLSNQSFYLENVDQVLDETNEQTKQQLRSLIRFLETSIFNVLDSDVVPVYDEANLIIAIQNATKSFHSLWNARLGIISVSGEPKRHWATVKALSKRKALDFDDGEFRDLRPVAEITDFLMEQVKRVLNNPVYWVPETNDEEQKKIAANKIARDIHTKLLDYCTNQFWKSHISQWNVAYEYTGMDSSKKRAKEILSIYDKASPIPGEMATADSYQYLSDIRKLVKESISSKGGKIISP